MMWNENRAKTSSFSQFKSHREINNNEVNFHLQYWIMGKVSLLDQFWMLDPSRLVYSILYWGNGLRWSSSGCWKGCGVKDTIWFVSYSHWLLREYSLRVCNRKVPRTCSTFTAVATDAHYKNFELFTNTILILYHKCFQCKYIYGVKFFCWFKINIFRISILLMLVFF